MPTSEAIEADFKAKVSHQVSLYPEGEGRLRVFTPFRFDDGDHLAIVLKRAGARWVLSDEGHTFMHLTYAVSEKDLEQGNRQKIIQRALATFGVQDADGELLFAVEGERFGDALFSFVQALLRIADVAYLNREVVKSTFMDDLRSLVKQAVPDARAVFDWHDPTSDPDGKYPVDARVEGNGVPLFVFGVGTDEKCSLATIVIQHYRITGGGFRSLAVFKDQETVGRKQLARLTDVVDKQFSNLDSNRDPIASYLAEWVAHSGNGSGR